jgi:hypothetical protein
MNGVQAEAADSEAPVEQRRTRSSPSALAHDDIYLLSISASRPQLRSSVNMVLGMHRKAECSTVLHSTPV